MDSRRLLLTISLTILGASGFRNTATAQSIRFGHSVVPVLLASAQNPVEGDSANGGADAAIGVRELGAIVLEKKAGLDAAAKSAKAVEPAAVTKADQLARESDEAIRKGRRLALEGRAEEARASFDRAVDLLMEALPLNPDRMQAERRLEQAVETIHRQDLARLGAAAAPTEMLFDRAPLEDILTMTFPIDPRMKAEVREQLQATSSQLPLEVNDLVLGYINYFSNGRGRNTIIGGLQRAGKYRPLIQRILDEEGVPQELIHLAQAESGFLPRAVSSKKAGGMWQFVAWRGNEYGLKQTGVTDDRFDPEKATRAAARHLRDLYQRYGDWYLAIAAYNCGPGNVDKAIERTGYADFWELRARNVLPRETTNYVPIIVAMTIMAKNAERYGLDGISPEKPLDYDTVVVETPTHLALVADLTDSSLAQIQAMNPAVMKGMAPAGYPVHVPRGSAAPMIAMLEAVPAERRSSWRVHRVEEGDTIAGISKRYGAAPASIADANRLGSVAPVAGDLLVIPAAYRPAAALASVPKRNAKSGSTPTAGKRAVPSRKTKTAQAGKRMAPAAARKPGTRTLAQARTGSARRPQGLAAHHPMSAAISR